MKQENIIAVIVFITGVISAAGVYFTVKNKAHRLTVFAFLALFICSILILLFNTQDLIIDLVSSIFMMIFAVAGCVIWLAKFVWR